MMPFITIVYLLLANKISDMMMVTARLFTAGTQTPEANNESSVVVDEDNCGQICSVEFSSKEDGLYYPLLR